MLIESFLNYISLEKNYSNHTVKAYRLDLQKFLSFLELEYSLEGEEECLKEVSYPQIKLWIRRLSEKGNTSRTINRRLVVIKSFYKFLLRIKEVSSSPMTSHKSLKMRAKLQTPLSEKEIQTLLDNNDIFPNNFEGIRDRAIMEFFYATGVRRSELINIKISNVDFSQKTLRVFGKGQKERILPITNNLINKIKAYLPKREQVNQLKREELFLNKKGNPLKETKLYKDVKKYIGLVSVKEKKSPHILRHSFATHLLNNGADINSIKELMGHSTLASTQHYTSSSLKNLKKAYNQAHPRNLK